MKLMAEDEIKIDEEDRRVRIVLLPEKGFEGKLTEKQALELDKTDVPIVLLISAVGSKVDWTAERVIEIFPLLRYLERESLINKRWRERINMKIFAVSAVVSLLGVTAGGSIGAGIKGLWKILFP